MKKFLLIFIAMFAAAPAIARICMVDNPAITVTHAQLADAADVTNCTFNISTPQYAGDGSAGAAWGVLSGGNTAEAAKCTVTGIAKCSHTSGTQSVKGNTGNDYGYNCWCRMTAPRVGAWVNAGTDDPCITVCAFRCAAYTLNNATFRAAILAPLTE